MRRRQAAPVQKNGKKMKGGLGPINAFSTLFGAILFSREKGKRERERETEREREKGREEREKVLG